MSNNPSQMIDEPELTQPVYECDANGNLNPKAIGWSRRPLQICNLSHHPFRKKLWNYWCFTNQKFLFSITVSNIDYMGLVFAYYLDFETKEFIEQTIMRPFGKECNLPPTVDGDVHFDDAHLSCAFTREAQYTRIRVDGDSFGGKPLHADLRVFHPEDQETLNVIIPWSQTRYQFTSKQHCLPVEGIVQTNGQSNSFDPCDSNSCLDFGRGVWKYVSSWNWGGFSGTHDHHRVGINLGGKWTDGTGMNENGFFVDGKLTKLHEDIRWEYSAADFMKPWKLTTTATNRVQLTFTPFYERVAKTNALVIQSEVHQMIGRYDGAITPENGEPIAIDNQIGWAEDHHARW
ncbi:MAG: DUF2804 domain-containing protein [Anaerolineaceae bacterium]